MNNNNDISIELQQISNTLASINKHNIYSVPVGYFDTLATIIVAKATSENLFLSTKANIYTTPNGYFNGLAENILAKVKEQKQPANEVFEELEAIAPILNTINKQPINYLPANYFETLSTNFVTNKPAKIVSLNTSSKWIKYAAAAVITGVLAIGGIQFFNNNKTINVSTEIAKQSDNEISNYLENEPTVDYAFTNTTVDEQEANGLFDGMTEEEIQQYLKEQPETAENAKKGI